MENPELTPLLTIRTSEKTSLSHGALGLLGTLAKLTFFFLLCVLGSCNIKKRKKRKRNREKKPRSSSTPRSSRQVPGTPAARAHAWNHVPGLACTRQERRSSTGVYGLSLLDYEQSIYIRLLCPQTTPRTSLLSGFRCKGRFTFRLCNMALTTTWAVALC